MQQFVADNLPSPNCISSSKCDASTAVLEAVIDQNSPIAGLVLPWPCLTSWWYSLHNVVQEGLCRTCADSVQNFHEHDVRLTLWNSLPSYFDLPLWDKLKDAEV